MSTRDPSIDVALAESAYLNQLRDRNATEAMKAMLSDPACELSPRDLAENAYAVANAMQVERVLERAK